MSEARQRWLRQMMGLGPAPDPGGLRLVEGKVRWLSEAQREIELAAWHREGRRARVAAGLAYLPQRVDRRRRRVQDRAQALVAERALARARTLRYRSRHLHPIGETQDIEGYFDLGRTGYRLDVVTPGLFSVAAEQDWTRGAVLRATESPWCGAETLLVPADTLDDQLIAEAIGRWYRKRFELQRGHWSQLEGRMPAIAVELAWERPDRLGRWDSPGDGGAQRAS